MNMFKICVLVLLESWCKCTNTCANTFLHRNNSNTKQNVLIFTYSIQKTDESSSEIKHVKYIL